MSAALLFLLFFVPKQCLPPHPDLGAEEGSYLVAEPEVLVGRETTGGGDTAVATIVHHPIIDITYRAKALYKALPIDRGTRRLRLLPSGMLVGLEERYLSLIP